MQLDLLGEPQTASSDLVSEDSTPSLFSQDDSATPEVTMEADTIEKEPKVAAAPAREKSPDAFKTITEVAELLDVQQYVLRFWESRFSQIKPVKMRGGRRYYRPEDIDILMTIKNLLYKQGYTIKGAKKALSGKSKPKAEMVAEKQESALPKEAVLSEKELSQLAVIRQELMGMRDVLKPHVF